MLNIDKSHRVALLIDADNAQLDQLQQILYFAPHYGSLTISRVYGDWKQLPLSTWHEKISQRPVEIIQVDRNGKDTTDKQILIDAGIMLGADQADTFIVVSSDRDFRLLCETIKRNNKKIVGIGNKAATSKSLPESCHEFYYIEDLEKTLHNLASPEHSFERLLYRALDEILGTKEGWIHCGLLGKKLRELEPDFESIFGSKKLSIWLKSLGKHFEYHNQMMRRIVQ